MTDIFSKEKRSWVMSRIRGRDTKIEELLETKLKANKIKFKSHPKLFGNPDFLIGENTLIFIDGCFWHRCSKHYREPKTKSEFWIPKIGRNVKRDREVNKHLKKHGYTIIRFWEHDIEKRPDMCTKKLLKTLNKST